MISLTYASEFGWNVRNLEGFYRDLERRLKQDPFKLIDTFYETLPSNGWLWKRNAYANVIENHQIIGDLKAELGLRLCQSFSSNEKQDVHSCSLLLHLHSRDNYLKLVDYARKLADELSKKQVNM